MKSLNSNMSERYEKPEMFITLFGGKNVIRTSPMIDTDWGNGDGDDEGVTFQ